MASTKRQSQHYDEDDDMDIEVSSQNSKRRREDSQPVEMIRIFRYLRSSLVTDIQRYIPDFFRPLIRQGLDHALIRQTINEAGTSGARFLQLKFENDLPATIFTSSNIKEPIKIALYDSRSQSIVTDGVYSSTKIEARVLDGEFGSDNSDQDWNAKDFNAKIIRVREDKGELLKGDTKVTLEKGVGYITNIMFTDISRCTRGGRFRLGVQSILSQENIREGISEPFVVRDRRGALNQKHYPPSPNDDIWRLTRIAKDGKLHQRLSSHGINTVKDLLRELHETDPSSLQQKFGKTSKKQREAIIVHAKTCVEVTSDGRQNHCPKSTVLNSDEKLLMEREKQNAYRNVKDFIPVDDISSSVLNLGSPLASVVQSAGHSGAPYFQGLHLPSTQQSQLETWPYLSQASNIGEGTYQLPDLEGMPLYSPE